MRTNGFSVEEVIVWIDERYKTIPGVVQRKKDDGDEWIDSVFSSHQAVTRVRRKTENIILNVAKGIFPETKKV